MGHFLRIRLNAAHNLSLKKSCSYFLPDNEHILYASTHEDSENCPEVPLRKEGKYVWPIYDSFDIYVSDLNGKITNKLTDQVGYDAEATVSPVGDKIVFTSTRNGDLDLYTMNIDGSDVKQITFDLGYDEYLKSGEQYYNETFKII